jgi:hypothetical protein
MAMERLKSVPKEMVNAELAQFLKRSDRLPPQVWGGNTAVPSTVRLSQIRELCPGLLINVKNVGDNRRGDATNV